MAALESSETEALLREAKGDSNCPICSRPFKYPKLLPCLHTFCAECVLELVRTRHGREFLQCPKCPKSVEIPSEYSPENLPTSLYHRRLLDLRLLENPHEATARCGSCDNRSTVVCYCFHCGEFLCDECLNAHRLVKVLKEHRLVRLDQFQPKDVRNLLRKPLTCTERTHEEQDFEFLCKNCNICICEKCALSKHLGHEFTPIAEASAKLRPKLSDGVERLKSRIPVCERQVRRVNEAILLLERNINTVRRQIQKRIESLIEILKKHELKMMVKLDNISKEQTRKFSSQRKTFECQMVQLNECIEFCQSVLQRNLDSEILQTFPFVARRRDDLEKVTQGSPEVVTVSYLPDKTVEEAVEQSHLGKVHVSPTDAQCSSIEGKGLSEGFPNHQSQFTIVTGSSSGRMCHAKGDSVTVKIRNPKNELLTTEIDDRKDGRYIVSFVPRSRGDHEISISINDKDLTRSPFFLQVRERYKLLDLFGSTGASEQLFQQPRAIATSACGQLAVADSGNHRIQLFDCHGKQPKYLRQFGCPGNQKGGMRWPSGVAFDSESNLLVSDTENNRIQIYSKDREIILAFGQDEVENPQGICVTDKGDIAVCCGGQNPAIKLFSENGKFVRQFNNVENGRTPAYIAHESGRFFVSYVDGSVVKVYDDNGSFLYNIGLSESDQCIEYRPRGLTIDADNNLLVSNCKGLGVHIYSLEGRFLSTFGEEQEKFGLCRYVDVAVADDGRLFVLQDYGFSNRIRIFH